MDNLSEELSQIENGVSVQRASTSLKDEKVFESLFCERLKQAGWHCDPQRFNQNNKKRVDVAAYHEVFKDVWFGFELKIPRAICDLTKALRQMIDYRKQKNWTYPFKVFCLITPHRIDFIHIRYFWRWGFGVGNLDTMHVEFCNGEAKSTINLAIPNYARYCSISERINHILKRSTDGWNSYDDEY
jgi:hypothetical protein